MKRLFLIFIAALLCGCSDSTPPAPKFKPEMLVQPMNGAVACMTHDLLGQFALHASRGETTKAMAMFKAMQCIGFPPGQTYKVLSIEGHTIEFTHVNSTSSVGLWTFEEAMTRAKP